ncbi:hypothetical protein COCOR_06696 [Corallococcus coralloides DSM 2259]|uniref:Lipoprotein n=1 Tax=Corallococcus coralloides (strain ATCC 25202 / DSM 2259 / NBRC 100086 / M2) TaxID=1144275 RepID=H8MXS8_CORCM|nr:hypothetical protein [Corallococcus coralloides]AFE07068.1 hypothetical protein COCOR_06696 [Corallococcus coralloides DSM 2259]
MPMSRLPLMLAATAALCFSAGCSKKGMNKAESKEPMSATAMSSTGDQRCPMSVPGAQVQTQDTSDGVALMFTTTDPSQVSDLQARARRLLKEQSQGASEETPMGMARAEDLGDSSTEIQDGLDESATGGGGAQGMAGAPTVPAKAVATDTPQGITITYSAQDQMQKRQLIDEVHETARQLKGGLCPGM